MKKKSENKKTKTIKVDYLARVEGEGSLYIKFQDKKVLDVKLKIFEPPRFFEALLRGRNYLEAPDITARICGICPVAYQMSAVHAMESALNIKIDPMVRKLRRLIYCGEWIESHVLHIYMLHAPDFLGFSSAIEMAGRYPKIVERGLKLKKIGNKIISLLGGREVHPINVRVGGFYKIPDSSLFKSLEEDLKWAREAAYESVKWVSKFDFPEFEQNYELVSLVHPCEYPFNEGKIVSNKGLSISPKKFDDYFKEEHVAHSNALHSKIKGRGAYLVGPMARYNMNYEKLSDLVKSTAQEIQFPSTCLNPFKSIVVRSLEVLYAIDEALRILSEFEMPLEPYHKTKLKTSTGYACTEAPRGLLYHRYKIDDKGKILDAKIVPPTSQNQKSIEDDLGQLVPQFSDLSEEQLTWKCEQAVRNYDPCISCATHFLKLTKEEI